MPDPTPVTRRAVLAAGSAAVLSATMPVAVAEAADAPPLPLYPADFENWSGEITLPAVLTCAPTTQAQVAAAATWAHRHGYNVRPRGAGHGWSPLLGESGSSRAVLLVDTRGLTGISENGGPGAVRVECGVSMERLAAFLADRGRGFGNLPDVGVPTVGGMLAIGAHGCAVPADGEPGTPGARFGSMSNRVLELTAAVWDRAAQSFRLRTYQRDDPTIGALLTSVGRAFITEAVLATEPDQYLRCVSSTDVPIAELLGRPGSPGRTVERYLRSSGRVDILWYAFADRPWLKAWYVSPTRPLLSRRVTKPYNYPFTDNLPDQVADLAAEMISGNPAVAPLFGPLSLAVTSVGLLGTASGDLWGRSKDVLLWLRPTTLRVHQQSYTVLTRRPDAQRVLHEFHQAFVTLRDGFARRGEYPINMPLEIRVSGLDDATGLGSGAQRAALSPISSDPAVDPWQVAVWISVATLPGTPGHHRFNRAIERWLFGRYAGGIGLARPEWSKGWAYTDDAGWTDAETLATIRQRFPGGPSTPGFADASSALDALDPHRVFSSPLTDRLFGI